MIRGPLVCRATQAGFWQPIHLGCLLQGGLNHTVPGQCSSLWPARMSWCCRWLQSWRSFRDQSGDGLSSEDTSSVILLLRAKQCYVFYDGSFKVSGIFWWWGLMHLCSNIIVVLGYDEPTLPFLIDFPFALDAVQTPKSTWLWCVLYKVWKYSLARTFFSCFAFPCEDSKNNSPSWETGTNSDGSCSWIKLVWNKNKK